MTDEASTIKDSISSLHHQRVSRQVVELGLEDPDAAVEGILGMIQRLSPAQRENAVTALRRGVIFDLQSAAGGRPFFCSVLRVLF
jgi:hypothetical protein